VRQEGQPPLLKRRSARTKPPWYVELPIDGLIQVTLLNCGNGRSTCGLLLVPSSCGATWLRLRSLAVKWWLTLPM